MKKLAIIGFALLVGFNISTFAQVGINTQNPKGIFNIDGKSTASTTNPSTGDPTEKQLSDDFIIDKTGATGIGTMPNKYSMLDVSASDKGILIPRLTLTSDQMDLNSDGDNDISNQPAGLLVYHVSSKTSDNTLSSGYYFWNGSKWERLYSRSGVLAQANINCSNPILDPNQLIRGGVSIIPGTVMKVNYSGGNGGSYNGVTLYSQGNPNIKATLQSGYVEEGSGIFNFYITGTPTTAQQSPNGIQFDLTPFYTANPSFSEGCTVLKVGAEIQATIETSAVQDVFKYTNDSGVPGYSVNLASPDGKFTVRAFIAENDATFGTDSRAGMNLQIRNNTDNDIIIAGQYNWQWGGSGGNGSNLLGLQPGKWSGDQEVNMDNQSEVSWATYLDGTSSNVNCVPITAGNSKTLSCNKSTYWGNPGIYAGGRPERRTYSWTENSKNSKTAYILTFSSYSSQPTSQANSMSCPNGICQNTGAYMTIQQITAP